MNTSSFSREQFKAFRKAFLKQANTKAIEPHHVILHNLVRGLPAERGFTSITNTRKLENGAQPDWSYQAARTTLVWMLKKHSDKLIATYGDIINAPEVMNFAQA